MDRRCKTKKKFFFLVFVRKEYFGHFYFKPGFQGAFRSSLMSFSLLIHCKTKTKKVRGFYKKIHGFQNLMKIEFCKRLILKFLITYKS